MAMNFGRRGKQNMSPFDLLSQQAPSQAGNVPSMFQDLVGAGAKLKALDEQERKLVDSGKPIPEDYWKQRDRIYARMRTWEKRTEQGGSTVSTEDFYRD